LDDVFAAIADVRNRFKLKIATLCLDNVAAYPGAKATLHKMTREVVSKHGTFVYSRPTPLLGGLQDTVFAEPVCTSAYSGNRIQPDHLEKVLRRVIEVCLQTIVQLPNRYPSPLPTAKQLKSAAAVLRKAAEKADSKLNQNEVRQRIELYFGDDLSGRSRLMDSASEIRWYASALDAVSNLKVKRVATDTPNPQVSLALYFVRWIEAATGGKHYANVQTLLEGAFSGANRSTPKWVQRMAIEGHSQRGRRKLRVKEISR
jgi:hypothetical protein